MTTELFPRPPLSVRTGAELAFALDRGLLTVLYQPVLELGRGGMVAVEALARLRDPTTGRLIGPAEFMPLAEASGIVGRVDRKVAHLAIPRAAAWRRLRSGLPFSVAINVSAHDLQDVGLPDRMSGLASRVGLPMNALVVELTETVLADAGEVQLDVLQRLVALDVNVTLDDFGTGFSSLTHLLTFPVRGIKIDRSFVREVGSGGRGEAITRSLIGLGSDIGVHVVAEGIETPEQLRLLRRYGCRLGQGYLLGRPMPAERITALLSGSSDRIPSPRPASAG
ncbi:MAG: EAL domain-containing protein [Actinomycetota bacterium]|nr:EAL domain-containing protein [Actinomycetota bacterium]